MTRDADPTLERPIAAQEYHAPVLTEFGSLSDLTRTGVGPLPGDATNLYNVLNQS